MAERSSTTFRRRELGRRLRELRTTRGLKLADVATELLCSETKVSRMESGGRPATLRDIRDLCRFYQVDEEERKELLRLANESREVAWWQPYNVSYGTYIDLEQSALEIIEYAMVIIPGLVQTRAYARAFTHAIFPNLDETELENVVEARMKRQEVLVGASPPRFWGIIDELAFQRVVGSREIMAEQMEHLVRMSRQPNVDLQVIPIDAQVHPGYPYPFILVQFDDPTATPVVYVEGNFGDIYLERQGDVDRAKDILNQLRASGTGTNDSRQLIEAARDRFSTVQSVE
jgi:transcriptional regulator with XRE-family HTH domain